MNFEASRVLCIGDVMLDRCTIFGCVKNLAHFHIESVAVDLIFRPLPPALPG